MISIVDYRNNNNSMKPNNINNSSSNNNNNKPAESGKDEFYRCGPLLRRVRNIFQQIPNKLKIIKFPENELKEKK